MTSVFFLLVFVFDITTSAGMMFANFRIITRRLIADQ